MQYDYIIVGSGLFGATFAYLANKEGKKCLVLEKRSHIGGNCYCENIDGINVHKYGPHIFHTNDKEIWDFVNSFVGFNSYVNMPIANYKGKIYHLPFNMNTFYDMWGITDKEKVMSIIKEQSKAIKSVPKNLEEQAISMVGADIYNILIKGYTEKQWGRNCKDLPTNIIKRLPLRYSFNNNYFNDKYQGIPIGGYNILFEKLLEGIEVKFNVDFNIDKDYWVKQCKKVIYTGSIDSFFDYCFGRLEYRTVEWETSVIDDYSYQGTAVINYTDREVPYTRIIEHKYFECLNEEEVRCNDRTIISKEYSKEWDEASEPFYPINDDRNESLYEKYKGLSLNNDKILFGGRLAEYRYYDMDKTIKMAKELMEVEKISNNIYNI